MTRTGATRRCAMSPHRETRASLPSVGAADTLHLLLVVVQALSRKTGTLPKSQRSFCLTKAPSIEEVGTHVRTRDRYCQVVQ